MQNIFEINGGAKLKGEQLRILLAGMVLLVCVKMAFDLVVEPEELFSVSAITVEGH